MLRNHCASILLQSFGKEAGSSTTAVVDKAEERALVKALLDTVQEMQQARRQRVH